MYNVILLLSYCSCVWQNDGDEGFWVVQDGGFILWHLFRHDRVRVHLTLLSYFMKTWCLAYY